MVERWEEIRRLHQAGAEVRDRSQARHEPSHRLPFQDLTEAPEFGQHRRRGSVLDPGVPYILRRWEEGCRNGHELFREIQGQGCSYSESNLGRLVAELRRSDGLTPDSPGDIAPPAPAARAPGTRHIVSLFLRRQRVSRKNRRPISSGFGPPMRRLVRSTSSRSDSLPDQRSRRRATGGVVSGGGSCEAPALRRFATSLKSDLAAVRAGLMGSWNNGPVEGFIRKLKLVKRQGYGRTNIDLLKARVMAA